MNEAKCKNSFGPRLSSLVSRHHCRRTVSLQFKNDFCRVSQLINAYLKCDNAMSFVCYYTHTRTVFEHFFCAQLRKNHSSSLAFFLLQTH